MGTHRIKGGEIRYLISLCEVFVKEVFVEVEYLFDRPEKPFPVMSTLFCLLDCFILFILVRLFNGKTEGNHYRAV